MSPFRKNFLFPFGKTDNAYVSKPHAADDFKSRA